MNCFIVISPHIEKVQEAVQENFPEYNHQIAPGSWAVASDRNGPSEVCKLLDMGEKNDAVHGVVCSLDAYYGFFDAALWEKLNTWVAL